MVIWLCLGRHASARPSLRASQTGRISASPPSTFRSCAPTRSGSLAAFRAMWCCGSSPRDLQTSGGRSCPLLRLHPRSVGSLCSWLHSFTALSFCVVSGRETEIVQQSDLMQVVFVMLAFADVVVQEPTLDPTDAEGIHETVSPTAELAHAVLHLPVEDSADVSTIGELDESHDAEDVEVPLRVTIKPTTQAGSSLGRGHRRSQSAGPILSEHVLELVAASRHSVKHM
eukprot:m.257922 g.257922  ORF g.257922 m.257922 type:complete len:228 (+) comp54575_c0_seq10:1000-1683(+)